MQIFQVMNSTKSNNLHYKYRRFILSGCKDIGIRKFKFVTETHFFHIFYQSPPPEPITETMLSPHTKLIFLEYLRFFFQFFFTLTIESRSMRDTYC